MNRPRIVINTAAVFAEMERRDVINATPDLCDLPQGWFNHGPRVLALLEQRRPRVVVEVGTWLGASAIAMARVVRRWGGTVTCIDAWSGDLTVDGAANPGPPLMILSCARVMVDAGVSANVPLIPAYSLDVAATWVESIDFLYLDGDHGYSGCLADLMAWVPHVAKRGMIAGDDYDHPLYPGVSQAWDVFEKTNKHSFTRFQSVPPHKDGVRLVYGEVNAMAETVKVRVLKYHTVGGKAYDAGDEYELEADLLGTVTAQRMAERVHDKTPVVEDTGKVERKDLRAKP